MTIPLNSPKIDVQDIIPKTVGVQLAKSFTARLGNPTLDYQVSVTESDKLGLVYIHGVGDLLDSVFTAENRAGVKLIPKALVEVGYAENGRYKILGNASENSEYMDGVNTNDQIPVNRSQLLEGGLTPNDSTDAHYTGTVYIVDGVPKNTTSKNTSNLIDGSTDDTSASSIDVPTTANQALMVLVQINPTSDTITYKQSAEFNATFSFNLIASSGYLPSPDSGNAIAGYIKLVKGMTTIRREHIFSMPDIFRLTSSSGGGSSNEITITAGEDLSEINNIYHDSSDNKWYAIDTDASPIKCSGYRAVVTESGGILTNATGTAQRSGVVSGYTGLTAGATVWASTTPGGYTQTKPNPTLGGSQIAVVEIGLAISTTEVLVDMKPVQYMKSDTLADDGTLTVEHHTDAEGRERDASVYLVSETAGASLASYADSNQDTDVSLEGSVLAGDSISQASSTTSTSIGDAAGTEYRLGQSFTTVNGGELTQFTVGLGANNGTPSGDITWQIMTNDGTDPNTELATGTFTPVESSTNTVNTSGLILDPATKYWLVLSTVAQGTNSRYVWSNTTANPYAGGNMVWSTDTGSSWTQFATRDLVFSVTLSATTELDKLAQSFEVSGAQTVKSANLWLKKTGVPTGTMTLRIETDNAGEPSGTLVHANATTTLAESSLGTSYADATFTFASSFSISDATTYWLVLSTNRSQSDTNYIEWGADESSPSYADGEMMSYALSASDTITIATSGAQEAVGEAGGNQYSQAQSFTPDDSGNLTQLKFYMGTQVGSPSGTMTIDICNDSSDSPGSVIDSETTTPGGSGTTTTVSLDNIAVTASTKYWIVWRSTSSQSSGNRWNIKGNSSDVYAGGKSQISDDGGSTWGDHGSTNDFQIDLTISDIGEWTAESADAVFEVFGEGVEYNAPALVDDWETALSVFGARYDDGSGSDPSTNTTIKNYTGVSKDVIAIVRLN